MNSKAVLNMALRRLANAMGNPALIADAPETLESALVNEAAKRFQEQPDFRSLMAEHKQESLTEFRLQTIHQEHIAKQAENVVLLLSLIVRVFLPDEDKEAAEVMRKLLEDFKKEGMQWRERFEYVTMDGRRDS